MNRMPAFQTRSWLLMAACLAALGCTLRPPGAALKPAGSGAEGTLRGGGAKATVGKAPSPVPDAFFGRGAGGVIANNGGTIVSNNGGSLVGVVRAPASLISNSGGTIISNGAGGYRIADGGYRVAAAEAQVVVAGAEVMLVTASGVPVTDAKGAVLTAKTDAQGRYKLPFSGASANLVARVALPGQKGSLLAFVARRETQGERTVDVSFQSTLVMGYIMGQYVKGDQAILEKLPEDVETETRQKMTRAVETGTLATPGALTSESIGQAVDSLRRQDPAIDEQMELVKRLLLVGLADQGAGRPALSVETDAVALAISPSGELFYGGLNTARVWRQDAQGLLRPFAGHGKRATPAEELAAPPGAPAPGDGGPASAAAIYPTALAFDRPGNLYIGDSFLKRVRRVDARGVITTVASHPDWKDLKAIDVAPDGTLRVATKTAIDQVSATGTVTRLAGGARGVPAAGPVASLRFEAISDMVVEPATGDLLVLDEIGYVVRLAGETATLVAGNGQDGFGGDGGPATSATFSGTGGLDVAPDGAIVMADLGNRRVRRIANGTITTVAGNGGFGFKGDGGAATQAGMVNPRSLRVGPDGAYYTADVGFVRRVKDGTIATVIGQTSEAGATPADQIQLRNPKGLWYDPAGHAIYVAELWRLRRWNLQTHMVETVVGAGLGGQPFSEGGAPTASTLFNFYGLAMGPGGALTYLAEDTTFRRRLLRSQDGKQVSLAGTSDACDMFSLLLQFDLPAVDTCIPAGSYPVAVRGDKAYYGIHLGGNLKKAVILEVSPGGRVAELCRVDSATMALGLGVSPDGAQLYIGASGRIYRHDFASKQTTEVARDGGQGTPNELALPTSFAWDAQGRAHYADFVTGRVRRVNADGSITAIAGRDAPLLNQSTVDGGLVSPWGLAFDRDGNLYVSDMGANQIKKIPAAQLP
jgi:sugar lactone lactonase YvrE